MSNSSSRNVNGHYARKRFGQNFLHDKYIISQIVDAVSPQTNEHIIEIGPGLGAITDSLLQEVTACNGKLTVLELDRDLSARLRIGIGAIDNTNLVIVETNALEFDYNSLTSEENGIRVVGNLPYNISTPLLFHLMSYAPLIKDMYFMLQKEVVDRITAEPNSKTYGRLSVMMQYHAKASFLFYVPKGAFNPPPKVTSAVFRLLPYSEKPIQAKDETVFANVVRDAFNQRRKTLRAIFKKRISAEQMEAIGLDPMARPETLSVTNFVHLADLLA